MWSLWCVCYVICYYCVYFCTPLNSRFFQNLQWLVMNKQWRRAFLCVQNRTGSVYDETDYICCCVHSLTLALSHQCVYSLVCLWKDCVIYTVLKLLLAQQWRFWWRNDGMNKKIILVFCTSMQVYVFFLCPTRTHKHTHNHATHTHTHTHTQHATS